MRKDKFVPIKELFFDYLEKETEKINKDFNYASCRAYTHFPSEEYDVGVGFFAIIVDCLLKDVRYDKTDNLGLVIEVSDENNNLRINADICWGNPYSKIEAGIFEEPVEINEETLAIIKEKLPHLVTKFRKLIRDNPSGV